MDTLKLFKKDFYERIGGLKKFSGLNVLDLGCGDGEDAFEIAKYAKKVTGVDIVRNSEWKKRKKTNLKFVISKAEKLPFKSKTFDGLFLKDVIHHVENIDKTLKEIKRVTTDNALIILIEGNRYNPLFYFHMTKMLGHEHLSQNNFKRKVTKYFPNTTFKNFEAHFIPFIGIETFKKIIVLEKMLVKIPFIKSFLSYNVAVIKVS